MAGAVGDAYGAARPSPTSPPPTAALSASPVVSEAEEKPAGGSSEARPPVVGDPTSRAVLDAFFLGKALAETINERLGNAVGEVLSNISSMQAEQREQAHQFQEEVKERARAALTKASKDATEKSNR
eukprot:SM000050S17003  [mRNA]  locus=s50:308766:309549:- [translate_table: standard]